MKRLVFASALLGLCCLAGCSNDEVKPPDAEKVSKEPVGAASMTSGEGGGGGGSSMTAEPQGVD